MKVVKGNFGKDKDSDNKEESLEKTVSAGEALRVMADMLDEDQGDTGVVYSDVVVVLNSDEHTQAGFMTTMGMGDTYVSLALVQASLVDLMRGESDE